MKYVPIVREEGWRQTSRGVDYAEFKPGKYFISYVHPEARVADNLLYYGLIDAVREIKALCPLNI